MEVETEKPALENPAGTANEDGTIAFALLELNETAVPPAGAVALMVTTQVEGAGGITESGVHEMPVTEVVDPVMVTELPDPVAASVEPPAETPLAFKSDINDEVSVVEAMVKAMVATTPLAIVFKFVPETTHVETPAELLQLIVLPAAVATGPTETVRAVKSLVAYVIVHWTAEGAVPVEDSDRFKVTTLPAAPEPDERTKVL